MARLYFRVSAKDLRQVVKQKVDGPIIALSKNPNVMRLITNKAIEIVTPYVPMKSGALRASAHTVYHAKQVQAVWGDNNIGSKGQPTKVYAQYQHDVDDSKWRWKRTTPGTKSHWTEEVMRGTPGFDELVEFATPLVKKEVKRGSK